MGKIYVQFVVDAFCSLAFAKVYTSKMPITAADFLYDRVLHHAITINIRGNSYRLKDKFKAGLIRTDEPAVEQ